MGKKKAGSPARGAPAAKKRSMQKTAAEAQSDPHSAALERIMARMDRKTPRQRGFCRKRLLTGKLTGGKWPCCDKVARPQTASHRAVELPLIQQVLLLLVVPTQSSP